MSKSCKGSTAQRRRKRGKYKDQGASWTKTNKGWQYGRKVHISLDLGNKLIIDWIITGGSTHDSKVAPKMADTCKGFKYILADSAYDSNQFYGYIFEKTSLIPVIDTNRRRGLDTEKQKQFRWLAIGLKKLHSMRYKLREEIERTNSILEGILDSEFIWYTRNRDFDTAIGLKILTYNLVVIYNHLHGRSLRRIMDIIHAI